MLMECTRELGVSKETKLQKVLAFIAVKIFKRYMYVHFLLNDRKRINDIYLSTNLTSILKYMQLF
jgi:hypothetical protein